MKVVLLVPDGVGIRNFVIGRFLHELSEVAEVLVMHAIPEDLVSRYADEAPASVRWRPMSPYAPNLTTATLQYTLSQGHMYSANTPSMQRALAIPPKGSVFGRTWVHATRLAGRVAAALGAVDWLDDLHCGSVERLPETSYYRREFEDFKPDVLFCSHQRPASVTPAVLAAKQMGVPAASFIFSWDNLSSKGRICAPFDHYFVWSDYMADELQRFYPRVKRDHVVVVGTPQFDPYADPSIHWTREEFFRRVGADPSRKLICYSGGDAGTCPEDPLHVGVLMRLIREGRIAGNPQVLVRPVPVDDGKRYADVRREYPEMIYCQPEWTFPTVGDWSKVLPSAEDVQFLVNLAAHADMNINLGSTMTLDFGLHDKPVVNMAFDINDPPLFGMPVYDYYYNFDHFQPVLEFGASRVARSEEELTDFVNAYLENPALDRQGRRKLLEQQVNVPLGESGGRITAALSRIAGSRDRREDRVLQSTR
ncbi:MAG: hypothetical protein R2762_11610 [Bryobacteraceae bacterium]